MKVSHRRFAQAGPSLGRCALAVALAAASAAKAQDSGMGIRFSGFGTLAAVHSSEKNADFTSVLNQPNGVGYSHGWGFNPDSKLAGQADVKFNNQFSATGQVMTRYKYDNSYTPEVMMAFAKWQATPEFAVRAGRLPLPVFLISESRTVGYSQPQVRPPIDMYRLFGSYHYDGADLTWVKQIGNVSVKSQVYGGKWAAKTSPDTDVDFSPLFGANLTGEVGDLTLRASYAHLQLSVSSPGLNGLFQGVRYGFPAGTLGPGSPAIAGSPAVADQYDLTAKHSSHYTSLGFNYDPGRWFVTGEVSQAAESSVNPTFTSGYLTGGMRFGDFTPYATVSRVKTRIAGSDTFNPIVDGIRQSSAAVGQKSLSLGLRWDALKNVALKTQFDRSKPDSDSVGQLINVQPAFQRGKAYSIFSVAADFVF